VGVVEVEVVVLLTGDRGVSFKGFFLHECAPTPTTLASAPTVVVVEDFRGGSLMDVLKNQGSCPCVSVNGFVCACDAPRSARAPPGALFVRGFALDTGSSTCRYLCKPPGALFSRFVLMTGVGSLTDDTTLLLAPKERGGDAEVSSTNELVRSLTFEGTFLSKVSSCMGGFFFPFGGEGGGTDFPRDFGRRLGGESLALGAEDERGGPDFPRDVGRGRGGESKVRADDDKGGETNFFSRDFGLWLGEESEVRVGDGVRGTDFPRDLDRALLPFGPGFTSSTTRGLVTEDLDLTGVTGGVTGFFSSTFECRLFFVCTFGSGSSTKHSVGLVTELFFAAAPFAPWDPLPTFPSRPGAFFPAPVLLPLPAPLCTLSVVLRAVFLTRAGFFELELGFFFGRGEALFFLELFIAFFFIVFFWLDFFLDAEQGRFFATV